MIFTLSAGEVLHIGDAVTLTVLSVEGDLIRLVLETPDGSMWSAGDLGTESEVARFRHRQQRWELN
jgi:hypothetical protein